MKEITSLLTLLPLQGNNKMAKFLSSKEAAKLEYLLDEADCAVSDARQILEGVTVVEDFSSEVDQLIHTIQDDFIDSLVELKESWKKMLGGVE